MADWRKVMFNDESTFRLVQGRKSWSVGLQKSPDMTPGTYVIKTVKHPKTVMVWGAFGGDKGRGGLYYLPNNVTMRGDNYLRVLDHHILPFRDIRRCNHFM